MDIFDIIRCALEERGWTKGIRGYVYYKDSYSLHVFKGKDLYKGYIDNVSPTIVCLSLWKYLGGAETDNLGRFSIDLIDLACFEEFDKLLAECISKKRKKLSWFYERDREAPES